MCYGSKLEIVLAGMRGDRSVRGVCREHGISEPLCHGWRDKILEAGREALAGKRAARASASCAATALRVGAHDIGRCDGTTITVFGTGPYLIGMLRGRIRPHAFTWLVWTVTTLIAFVAQLVGGGGIGAAAAGASAFVGLVVSGYAFWRGDRAYTQLDWLCLVGAAVALVAWGFAGGPLSALILIALVDAIGAVPTIRKAFAKPDEEGISPFILANAKWLLAIYALDHLNALTLLFPATTTAVNTAIITVVLVRRAQVQRRGAGKRTA